MRYSGRRHDLLRARAEGRAAFKAFGQVNSELPFMPDAADDECLARLRLDRPATFSERAYRALVGAVPARAE